MGHTSAAEARRQRERERERRGSMIDEAMLRTVATYVLYATAGFLFLPAGRDIVSHKTCILPGEKDMRKAMNATSVKVRTFFWGVWGMNHCMMSALKIYAVQTIICLGYLITQRKVCLAAKADLTGFMFVFILEALAISYLAFM